MPPPPVNKLIFAASIVTPLAQVTVVDGDEGDCNVVDFCRLPTTTDGSTSPKVVYQDQAWRRTIIDTGPKGGTNILATLQLLATTQSYPALATDPTWSDVPVLDELQITHPDDDHIGNAAQFLTNMCTTANVDFIKRCNVVYCRIPSLYKQPTIAADKPIPYKDKNGITLNKCTYRASISKAWQNLMEKSGFELQLDVYPQTDDIQDWSFAQNDAKWDDDTQDRVSGPTCTLYYTSQAVNNNLKPELEAQVTIFLPEQGNLKATAERKTNKLKTRKWWESTVSRDKDTLSSAYMQVPMTKKQLDRNLRGQEDFDLEWDPSPPTKKKNFNATLPTKLMSSMVVRRPLAVASSIAINGSTESAVEGEQHIVRSVRQVLDLGTTITQLNQSATLPKLRTVVPEAKQIVRPTTTKDLKTAVGYQYTIGPSAALYKDMMRTIMLNRWALDGVKKLDSPGAKNNLDSEATNRSSIVTMFERHDKYPSKNLDATFSMLFTGDAFDRTCDIRDTLLSWKSDTIDPTMQVDVLKIPHHGSDVSANSSFYSFCRASVYLVCGSHCNTHGNPKLSMLEAIVKGFYGKSAPGSQPFRLFFSNPNADTDWSTPVTGKTKSRSAVKAILANPTLKPSPTLSATSYYYEMYKLKGVAAGYAAFGEILIGKDGHNDLVTTWNAAKWVRMG